MTMPERVQIGPFRYDVRRTIAGKKWQKGLIEYDKTCISVHPDLSEERAREVLLHEIMHACSNLSGLFRYTDDSDQAEKIINAFTPALLDTLRRNPDLVAYLMGGDPR